MMESKAAELLTLVAGNEGISVARAARRLGLAQSQLLRLLAALGNDAATGAPGLIDVRVEARRSLLYLMPLENQR